MADAKGLEPLQRSSRPHRFRGGVVLLYEHPLVQLLRPKTAQTPFGLKTIACRVTVCKSYF